MSYQLKTLVVFDTNSLRSTEAGEVAYSFFAFGKPYQVIEEFITENALREDVHIAIPSWTIEELKDQKQRQYQADVVEYQKLAKRLSGLPHIPELAIHDDKFDCAAYVHDKAIEYVHSKAIIILEIKEGVANDVLRSMMTRVMRDENKKAPFANLGKTYKDAGFKDNIVWESLMNYEDTGIYDKVIFLTKDGDFNKHCESEFRQRWDRHIAIIKDENSVIAEIKKDYGNYIDERIVYEYAQSEYYTKYLEGELNTKTIIVIDGADFKIASNGIHKHCKKVDRIPPDENGNENVIITIDILFVYDDGMNDVKHYVVEASTTLLDEESKEIISTDFDTELR
jgi:hypothetical protein